MNHQALIEIVNAKNSLKAIVDINAKFLETCAKNPEAQELQSRLSVSGASIAVDCFGYVAKAECRFVRASSGGFVAEYLFQIPYRESFVEVWRAYVTTSGRFALDPNAEQHLCDYNNNSYVAKHICSAVLAGSLRSSLFAEAPREGG